VRHGFTIGGAYRSLFLVDAFSVMETLLLEWGSLHKVLGCRSPQVLQTGSFPEGG
jgi:hypothetical protein